MLNAHALHTSARGIASRIGSIEQSIDESFARTASLLAYLPEARAAANLPVTAGHKGLMRTLASLNSIAQAREEMVAAHLEFSASREELRLPEIGLGSLTGCPTEDSLHLVASRVA